METVTTETHAIKRGDDDRASTPGCSHFEACASFRPGDDVGLCDCGWLEVDHSDAGAVITPLRRARRVRQVAMPERRAS